jgi:hypothetical protein
MRGGGSQRVLQDMQHVPLIASSGPHCGVIGVGLRLHYSMLCIGTAWYQTCLVPLDLGAQPMTWNLLLLLVLVVDSLLLPLELTASLQSQGRQIRSEAAASSCWHRIGLQGLRHC